MSCAACSQPYSLACSVCAGRPVVFLDIDGVLNSAIVARDPPLDPAAVAVLNRILAATAAVLVVSSTWRLGRDLATLQGLLVGVEGLVVDRTPELPGQPRWREIAAWLAEHPRSRFVILDDMPDMGDLADAHVRTRSRSGLRPDDAGPATSRLAAAGPG